MSDITSNFTDGNPLLASELNGWKDDRTGDLLPIAPVSGASPYNYTGSTYNLGSATYPWATLYSTQVVTPLLRIYSGATPVFQVDASGTLESFFNVSGKNFGIGTSTPSYKLDVIATAATSSEVKTVARFYSFYSGSPTSSFGGELLFTVLAPNGNPYDIVRLNFVNSSSGSGYGDLSIKMRHETDATNYEAFRIYGGTNSVKSFYTLYAQHTETTNNALGRSPLIVNSAYAGATANGFGTAIALSAMAQNGNEYVLGKIAANLTGLPQANLEFWVRNTAGATYDGWDGMIRGGYFDYIGNFYLGYDLSVTGDIITTGRIRWAGTQYIGATSGTDSLILNATTTAVTTLVGANGPSSLIVSRFWPTTTANQSEPSCLIKDLIGGNGGTISSAHTFEIRPSFNASSSTTLSSFTYLKMASPSTNINVTVSNSYAFWIDSNLGTHLGTTNQDKTANSTIGTFVVNVNGVKGHIQIYADT